MKRFNSELKRLRLLSTGIFGINKQTSKEIGNVIDDIFFYAGYKSEDKHKLFRMDAYEYEWWQGPDGKLRFGLTIVITDYPRLN